MCCRAWRSIKAVPGFHPFLFQAKEKIRADQARAEAERAARIRRRNRMIRVTLSAVALVILSFVASFVIIVSRSWTSDDVWQAWADKHVPLMSVAKASVSLSNAPAKSSSCTLAAAPAALWQMSRNASQTLMTSPARRKSSPTTSITQPTTTSLPLYMDGPETGPAII